MYKTRCGSSGRNGIYWNRWNGLDWHYAVGEHSTDVLRKDGAILVVFHKGNVCTHIRRADQSFTGEMAMEKGFYSEKRGG